MAARALLPVWVWYEWPGSGPARYIQLNLQALHRHAPPSHFVVRYVNSSNIHEYLPNLPPVFWRLPTRVAFSDAARLGLLALHGGLYLDADFLVLRSLVPIAEMLERVDLVGYPYSPAHGEAESSADCERSGQISANFVAARPNTTLFWRSWTMLISVLPRKCSKARARKIYICCSDSATGEPLDKCRVPHATTDLMMSRIRPSLWRNNVSKSTTLHCLGDQDDLTTPRLLPPNGNGADLDKVLGLPKVQMRLIFGKWRLLGRSLGCANFDPWGPQSQSSKTYRVCCRRDGDDLACQSAAGRNGEARARGFYSRTRVGYHLFDSFQRDNFIMSSQIEWSNLTIAPLYRRALGISDE